MNLDPKALEACPHCGLGGDQIETVHEPDRPLPFYVYCDGCGARTGYHFTVQSAIAAWRRRAASVPADVAGLVDENREFELWWQGSIYAGEGIVAKIMCRAAWEGRAARERRAS